MPQGTASDPYPADDQTVTGWVRLGLTAGISSPDEIVVALRGMDLPSRFPADPAGCTRDVEALVQEVTSVHRSRQPGPSADARALLVAARAMSQAGVVVSLGDAESDADAREVAVERALRLRGTGAMVSGCAYASAEALRAMVRRRRLELGVCPIPDDQHSVVGTQIAQRLGLGHASPATIGPRVAEALVDAGLPGRWDGESCVTVEPIDFAAPVSD